MPNHMKLLQFRRNHFDNLYEKDHNLKQEIKDLLKELKTRELHVTKKTEKLSDMLKFIKKMAAKEVDVTQFYAAELVQVGQ